MMKPLHWSFLPAALAMLATLPGGGEAHGETRHVSRSASVNTCGVLHQKLQTALDNARAEQNIPAVAAVVDTGKCVFRGASGVSDVHSGVPARPEDLFRVGSITKTFVSTLVLMLRAEGRLSLDDTVSKYVHGIPGGDRITVRQLLSHRSGLYNYTESRGFSRALTKAPHHTFTQAELIAFAAEEGPYFEPGGGFHYSNTNYIVAGLIAEAVSGEKLAHLLRQRIIEPARLSHTYFDGGEPKAPGLVRGYARDEDSFADVTDENSPSAAGAAGALVSTAEDLAHFYGMLFGGHLLAPAELHDMTSWKPTKLPRWDGYGLGLVERTSEAGTFVGHSGSIWGFESQAYQKVQHGALITVLVNLEHSDPASIVDALSRIADAR